MKSTNRQFHLKLNPAKNYLTMCLLNCILISIVTLTHSLPISTTLSSAIEKHPKYRDTLLNATVVPFVTECSSTDKLKPQQEMLCGSYFEMIEKLDRSNVKGLTTVDEFTKAMNASNQTQIAEFCVTFPGYVPNNPNEYPYSHMLYDRLPTLCPVFCVDDNLVMVKPICQVSAIGFQLSNVDIQPVQPINAVTNSTFNQLSVEGIRNLGNVRADSSSKSDKASGSVKPDKDKLSAAMPINANDADVAIKQVVEAINAKAKVDEVDETIHEEKIDGLDGKAAKEDSSPIAESAVEGLQNMDFGEGEAKIDVSSGTKSNPTATVKQELKPTAKTLNPSENPIPNGETAEKPVINEEHSLVDTDIDEDVVKDDEDKENYKVVTEDNDDFDVNDVNTKDKLVNINDDSIETNEGDDMMDSQGAQSAKSPPEQAPSNEQLHNQEDPFTDDTDSNFFTYFMFLLLVCVIAYVVYHNKSKMLALLLEGRRSNTNGRSGLSRRKHTAAYRKLDSNLEEAITSSGNGRSTQVIY
ncbi:trans-Golgi network integral membrane protein 2-like [Bradysia coprophila]|uniref:trans-Golgi network integral membrane protein 2-like n=1 Tax=Bradysia coprophila TaxID=38358 RepID=UPI00187DBA11|nr:trans-Golgi network integral membrane protein 2-like [Bradysia coprophila]